MLNFIVIFMTKWDKMTVIEDLFIFLINKRRHLFRGDC